MDCHATSPTVSLWLAWRRVEEERAALEAEAQRRAEGIAVPAVLWRRRVYRTETEILDASPSGWARRDPAAMERHRVTVERLVQDLEEARRRADRERRTRGMVDLEARAQQLADEARRLAQAISREPVTGMADVLARLDVVAAMWAPDGTLAEPGVPLAEVLALVEELARGAPCFMPLWRGRRKS